MRLTHNQEYFLLNCFAAIVRFLPRRAAVFCGAAMGQIGWLTRMRRSLVLKNLRQALPEAGLPELKKIASRAARNFGRTAVEFLRFDGKDRERLDQLVTVEGHETLAAALEAKRGALIITAHLGSWALYFTALAAKGIPIALLVGKQHNAKIDQFIHRIPGDKVELISKGPTAPKKILLNLQEGRCIVLVADQHAGERGILSPFLGRSCSTLALPGALIEKYDPPLFLMKGHRVEGDRHHVSIQPIPLAPRDKATMRQDIADRFNAALGQAVLERPDQYFWYHRRWRASDSHLNR